MSHNTVKCRANFPSAIVYGAGCALSAIIFLCCHAIAATSDFPSDPRARELLERGRVLLGEKQLEAALLAFSEAVKLAPESGLAHFRYARALNQAGEVERSLAEYQIATGLKPHFAVTRYNMGDCFQSLGRIADAISSFEQFIREEPQHELVKMARVRIKALGKIEAVKSSDDANASDYLQAVQEAGGKRIWAEEAQPVKIYISDGSSISGFSPEYLKVARDCLDEWIAASDGGLRYELANDSGEASIVCDWTDDPLAVKKGGTGAEGGHTDVKWTQSLSDPAGTLKLYHAHVRVLVVASSSKKPVSAIDLKKVLLHEFGHALGIGGHSINNRDVMFFGTAPTVAPALSERDKNTIKKLYAR